MADTEKSAAARQRELERAWLKKPLTTGGGLALLGVNVVVLLLVTFYLVHRLDQLDLYVGSINR